MKSTLFGKIVMIFRQQKNLIFLLVMTAMLSACDKAKEIDKKPVLSEYYDIIDSGLISGGDSINWMDNNRIILRAVDPNNPSTGKIYIWEINSNKIIEYSEGGMPCYYDGYIYYGYKTDLKLTKEKPYGASWKEGEFENEKLFTRTHHKGEGKKWHKEHVRNKFSCRLSKRPKEMKEYIWVPFLEKHGYLEFGRRIFDNQDDGVYLHKPNGKKIELPFKRGLISWSGGQYLPFNNQYFFWDLITNNIERDEWKNNGCIDGWLINPDTGEANSECIPYAPWKSSHIVVPAKPGLFMVNYNYKGVDPRDSGGYLYANNKFKQVIKGRVRQVKVSPDGCKVALTHQLSISRKNKENREKMTLKVINICTEKE